VAERPVLEAVVFDAGGTLLRLDFEWMSGAVRALGHVVSAEALRRAEVSARKAFEEVFDEPPPAAVAGEPRLGEHGDTRLYFRVILEAAGVPLALVGPALERCFERQAGPGLWSRPAEGARGCLDALALLGLRLACVSNSDGRAEELLAACDMRRGLEFVVDSHHVGIAKPEAGIFRVALKRLGLPAERVLYVGDLRRVDGDGARGAGLHFVLLDPYGDYGVSGEPSIDTIARLPAWVTKHFTLATAGSGGGR
jgi:putative hydrolase of the HAD superfamily